MDISPDKKKCRTNSDVAQSFAFVVLVQFSKPETSPFLGQDSTGFSLVCYYFWESVELQICFSVRPIGAPKNAAIVDHISGRFDAG